jgi:hypothetical protein
MADECETKPNPALDLRERIEKSLHLRSAPKGTALAWLEERVKSGGVVMWRQIKKRPSLGVAGVAVTAIALASAVGVGELTVGAFAAYGAYLVLREGMAPREAALQVFERAR